MMPEGKMLWAYRAVFKQTNAGGGAINVRITMQERTEILYALIGPDDYAAGRTIQAFVQDATPSTVGRALAGTAVDQERLAFPVQTAAGDQENEFEKKLIIGKGEIINISAGGLVQNEEVTLAIRALISTTNPVVTTTGSAGTVTITVTYDKVI